MEPSEFGKAVLLLLFQQFQFDLAQMSKPWMYYWVLPIWFYLWFFLAKWLVLTMPLWLPIRLMFSPTKRESDNGN